jgi:serine/threonine protein kinase
VCGVQRQVVEEPLVVDSPSAGKTRLADRYMLGARLGRGGMAVVYRGYDDRLGREVAIKLIDTGPAMTSDVRRRFEREARLAASISHPNVVAVHDVGTEGDVLFLVMERLPGRSLADELRAGPLAEDRMRAVVTGVLAGLAAAHEKGVLHRDIKPGNVLLDNDGRVKLADFGIATSTTTDLTETGMVIGTPAYLAPERVAGARATPRSDLYAVGVVAYEALAGRQPFTGDTPLAVLHAIHAGRPQPLHELRPDIPRELSDLVMHTMSTDPDARPASAEAFAAQLAALRTTPSTGATSGDPGPTEPVAPVLAVEPTQQVPRVPDSKAEPSRPRSRRPAWWIAFVLVASALAAVIVGGLWSWLRDDPGPSEAPVTVTTSPQPAVPIELEAPFARLRDAVTP